MQERFINQGETTLDGAINNSVTTVTVTDGSVFPSSGQFRVVVGTEIMICTARATNDLTVTRGAESSAAASHSDLDVIVQGVTTGGLQQYVRDWVDPFVDVRKPCQLLDSSSATLDSTDFTNINFTNCTKTDSNGAIVLTHATQGASYDIGIVERTVSVPWTLTVGIMPNLLNASGDNPAVGLTVRDSTGSRLHFFSIEAQAGGTHLKVEKHATTTSAPTTFLSRQDYLGSGIVWMQAEDDNVDLIYRISSDGVNFLEVGREARLTYIAAPDRYGVGINNLGNAAVEAMATIVAWDEA